MIQSGIYKIRHIKSGKVYVGSAINFIKRWLDHKKELRGNYHHSILLQRAWNKYGENKFEFEIIEVIKNPTKKKLEKKEQYWMDYYKSYDLMKGYNICPKANSRLGLQWSLKSRKAKRKFWKSTKGKKYKKIMSKIVKIRMNTPEAKKRSGDILRKWNRKISKNRGLL
jgi:group I intron endonuclease